MPLAETGSNKQAETIRTIKYEAGKKRLIAILPYADCRRS